MELQNISQLLLRAGSSHPEKGLVYYPLGSSSSDGLFVIYSDLVSRASAKASIIKSLNVPASTIFSLHFDQQQSSIEWFWAVTLAGYTPAISTPFSRNERQRHDHIKYINDLLDQPVCLTSSRLFPEFGSRCPMKLFAIEALESASMPRKEELFETTKKPSDVASLMLTSGSSGRPKVVILPHIMMLASVTAKTKVYGSAPCTTFLGWINFDHVAYLTETHLQAMVVGANQIHVHARDITQEPLNFLRIIDKHRVAYSFCPHFFLASIKQALEQEKRRGASESFDLSSLKMIVTGGEANVVDTCAELTNTMTRFGAPTTVLVPTWGMTETGAGAIYNTLFTAYDLAHHKEFASIGKPFEGLEMRIVDEDGKICDSDTVGDLEVRGDMVFREYLNNKAATEESFAACGWFRTGDVGVIDDAGMLHLVGRSKEIIIINGINYSPVEIESLFEQIDGMAPSYTAAVPYRPRGAATEGLGIIYLPSFDVHDSGRRVEVNNTITRLVMLHTGIRPLTVPVDDATLQKSTLGKLSRSKIQKSLANGEYRTFIEANIEETRRFREENYRGPTTETERIVLDVVCDCLSLCSNEIGVNQSIFSLGVNSIDLIKVKGRMTAKFRVEIPLFMIMSNPTVELLANAVDSVHRKLAYDPMVILQAQGSKTPLWLVHPGVGEVLVFLPLASYITDRPIYALRARGFEDGETPPTDWQEARDIYLEKIRSIQPHGPYAVAGYSYGSMIAFEIAKIFESSGEEVRFLGIFNLPPHIKNRMKQFDWTNCVLHLGYFLGFFSEAYALEIHPTLSNKSREEVLTWVLQKAPPERVKEIDLDRDKLSRWANVTFSLQSSATNYEPTGQVRHADVFCATPLAAVARSMEDWKENHLSRWAQFSTTPPELHEVDGAHYTMLGPGHVGGFQRKLKAALANRGV